MAVTTRSTTGQATADSSDDEHAQLVAEHTALEAAHAQLESRPNDLAGHREHIVRLHQHIERLHDYMRRRGFRASERRTARDDKVRPGE